MCFAQGTGYMLLDEPLNNLDIFYARELMRTLRQVADTTGRSIILVLARSQPMPLFMPTGLSGCVKERSSPTAAART